ncbi:MAG TPA: amidase family protein [Opitutaceae bacterium]|nr:amidase family protein [Opitutaceae bacterium]
MTFGDWQQLTPKAAAREIRRRAEVFVSPEQARAIIAFLPTEEALDSSFSAAPPGSPLRGVPYLLKDMFDVAGIATFGGSSFLPEVRPTPDTDSRIVRELAASGAVFAGKSQTFEFAWGLTGENAHYGDCERPRFPGRTSGGSSSGSAAAVAANIVPFAIGTDTGGSIRVPSAFCGVYGFRGTPGDDLIRDAVALAPSFDTAGWFTRTATDMRTVMAALAGPRSKAGNPRGCYIEMPELDPEVASACREAALRFAPEADKTTSDELRDKFASAAEIYGVIAGVESWKIHRKWAEKYRARYGPLLQDRLDRAKGVSPAQVAAVEPSYESLRHAWTKFFLAYDFLVMPSVPFPALLKADCTHASRLRLLGLTAPVSLGALPALSIPVELPSGLTCGLQIVVNNPRSPVIDWVLGQMQD